MNTVAARAVTDKQTDTQSKYRNPRCACAPRVNDGCKIMLCTIRIMYVYSIYSMCNNVHMCVCSCYKVHVSFDTANNYNTFNSQRVS